MSGTALLPLDTPVAIDAAVVDAARRATSPNSWRALRADMRVFGRWAAEQGLAILPARTADIAAFLREQGNCAKKSTKLARYAFSIAHVHALADLPGAGRHHSGGIAARARRITSRTTA